MARARLGMAFQDVRGTMGNQVLVLTRSGLVVRGKPRYKFPVSPATRAQTERMKAAAEVWNSLTIEQVEAWRRYGETQRRVDPVTLKEYTQTANTAFVGLSTKFLQASPGGAIPLLPPVSEFIGDSIVLTVAPVSPGVVRFAASGPNAPDVITEIMMQRLPNIRRSPKPFYASAAFHVFESGALEFDMELDAGVYAFAYRFVRLSTGQSVEPWLLGVVEVEAS
ncbi:MAG: hypothetical protein KIT74_09530 [Fimbriimonadales bacterium]|nr:hypothetical protein [Fimbriimonadales bacterium]